MKRRIFSFIVAGIGLMSTMSVMAEDVYVYSTAGENLATATDVRCIAFDNGKMTLIPVEGNKVEIDMSRMSCFSFKPIEVSGVSSVEKYGATVRLDGDILTVTSPVKIDGIRIYNALGVLIAYSAPDADMATVATTATGLNIVVVESGGVSQTYKIFR